MNKLLLILPAIALALVLTSTVFAQSDENSALETTTEMDAEVTSDPDNDEASQSDEVDSSEDRDVINSDQTESYETGIVTDNETEDSAEFDVEETEISGEVIEINDDYILIETADGEQIQISRGGGTLLSPFVRQAALGNVAVGDMVEVTVAESVTLDGEVKGVTESGALVVITKDGQERTIQPGLNNVVIRSNGQIVTNFNDLKPGDEIEVVYEGELISEIDTDDDSAGGWVTPVIIILIVLGLAAVLARRGKRLD